MKIQDLFERSIEERDPVTFVGKYKDDPQAYLHTGSIMKVGIYPKSSGSHDSPVGVYAYRIMDVWNDYIARWNTGEYKRGLSHLPYQGGDQLFILKSDIDTNFPEDYTEENLAADCEKLKSIYGFSDKTIKNLKAAAETNLNFRECPAGYLWGMTKAIAAGTYEFDDYTPTDCKKWNVLLRKLGYTGFNDPGYGLIHGAEGSQALFLTSSAFKIVDHMNKNMRQNITKINGTEYKGGRIPKDLHMKGFDSVFFMNHDRADFARIRRWTVEAMSVDQIAPFAAYLPWNAVGIIENLSMGNATNEDYERSNLRRFFAKPFPKNIKVKTIHVGGRNPADIIKLIPVDFPVDQIKINFFASDYGIDKLPDAIRAKVYKPEKYGI